MLCYIKLYIVITISMSLASPICLLFISIMQPVNRAPFLIVIFFLLLEFAVVPMFGTVIIQCMYASL